jgi:perosamine synthetase
MSTSPVPFFRPDVRDDEIQEVVEALKSGWLTTGPRVARFERDFADAVGSQFAVAVNSCTAALHLAVEALGLTAGGRVLVPTMTFAATAEVVRYMGATPVLVDCDPTTGNMDLDDAERRLDEARRSAGATHDAPIVGIMPVHVGGLMIDGGRLERLCRDRGLWMVEDAAHAIPAAWRPHPEAPWRRCGDGLANVTCFSFYANKTLTTGEGGMAVTSDAALADRMRLMSLHGLSRNAWGRYTEGGSWDYQIIAPGFKYNLTDMAAALGIHQLARAEQMRVRREAIAGIYRERLAPLGGMLELPVEDVNRIHSWHLFPLRLCLDRLTISRNTFIEELKALGINTAVHWRPLHLHPYYEKTFGLRPSDYPAATALFERIVSLPLFPTMSDGEIDRVVDAVTRTLTAHRR